MAREIKSDQNYQDRLLKLIPSEIVGAYMALQGIIPTDYAKWGTLVAAVLLVIITPFYLSRVQQITRTNQIVVTTLSLVVWIYTLGGPFQYFGLYQAWIGSAVLILWTLLVPIVVNPQE